MTDQAPDYAAIRDRSDLTGKVAVVTGGAHGLGAAHVHALAARGAAVLVADVDEQAGRAVVADAVAEGATATFARLDATSAADWRRARDVAAAELGAVNVLVNNAGVFGTDSVLTVTREAWKRVLDINLKGTFLGMQTFAPVIRDAGGGSIINVSSAAGLDMNPDPSYSASKWAVRGLTKSAALEFGEWGVRVNSIHPGYMVTAMSSFAPEPMRRAKIDLTPLRRAGHAWEAAECIAFLASDAAGFITGAELAVDGGWTSGVQIAEARRRR